MIARSKAPDPRRSLRRSRESSAQARIDEQRAIVASLEPGSDAHRMATEVLLLFMDSLHALKEAHELLERLNAVRRRG